MKVIQKNAENMTGFPRFKTSDFGLDFETDINGSHAAGFRYTDGAWWSGSAAADEQAKVVENVDAFLQIFKSMFTRMAEYFVFVVKPKRVLELGCGSGELSQYIRDLDVNIVSVTVDANEDTKFSPYYHQNHFIGRTDKKLDFEYENGDKVIFDLIISFEHFEHIPESSFAIFIDNVDKHSKSGTNLIFSVNLASYGNTEYRDVHCNVKPVNWWIDYIAKYGFVTYDTTDVGCGFEFGCRPQDYPRINKDDYINDVTAPSSPLKCLVKKINSSEHKKFIFGRAGQSVEIFSKKL